MKKYKGYMLVAEELFYPLSPKNRYQLSGVGPFVAYKYSRYEKFIITHRGADGGAEKQGRQHGAPYTYV